MVDRQLSSFNIEQMETYADSCWYSLEELQVLKNELRVRNTWTYPRVRDLEHKVTSRIALLTQIHELLYPDCLQSTIFRNWFFGKGAIDEIFEKAVVHGSYSLAEDKLVSFLDKTTVEYAGAFRSDVETLIIGRNGWDPDDLMDQLDLRTGKTIRIYSQEMVFAFLGCGKDPLHADRLLLEFFSNNHPGLKFLQSIGFPWPSTDVFLGLGDLEETNWPKVGLLRYMGYAVGQNGKPERRRHEILAEVYEKRDLPKVESPEYIEQWGSSRSSRRLQKMAESIASFARNRKRDNPSKFAKAINEWEADLDSLKERFYTGRYRFQWPDTVV